MTHAGLLTGFLEGLRTVSYRHFVEKQWRHEAGNTMSLCKLVGTVEIYLLEAISKWPHRSFEESLEYEAPDNWLKTEDYAYGAAVCRIASGLAEGKLKAFVPTSSKRMFEAAQTFWRDVRSGTLNVSAIMSSHLSAAPFGSDKSYEVPEEAEGREFRLKKVKVQAWLRDFMRPINRAYAPPGLLSYWYATSPLDDCTRRSKVKLRNKAMEDLGMRVSASQIDLLVAGEGRTAGRPRTVTE